MQIIKSIRGRAKYLYKQVLNLTLFVLRPYYAIRQVYPVWRFLNRKGTIYFKKHINNLSGAEKHIIEGLNQDGIAFATLDELFPGEGLLQEFQEYSDSLRPQAQIRHKKTFLSYMWDRIPTID